MVREIQEFKEFEELINGAKPVVVDFHATWCPPCKAIAPFYAKLAEKHGSNVVFIKVDVDKGEKIAAFAKIKAMPTFKVYNAGNQIEELLGANKDGLEALVEKAVGAATAE